MEQYLNKLPWGIIVILCLTLGLAPYKPPHIVEKFTMLFQGRLIRPLDWFDLVFHSIPWVLLVLKLLFGRK
jgi:F0F1-type ATP synthase assembly protein I